MNISIIGGGAIGLLFASYLSDQHEVTLYTNTEQQASRIHADGVRLIKNGKESTIHLKATSINSLTDEPQLVIVAVKQYHLQNLWPILNRFHQSTLLFLQNGTSHLPELSKLPSKKVMVGVVEHGAERIDERTVHHAGVGVTRYGVWKGNSEENLNHLDSPSFPFLLKDHPLQMLKEKLLVNCVINPLTALLQVKNGELLDNPHYYELFTKAFKEAIKALDLTSSQEKLFEKVSNICKKTSQNQSSMFKDLQLGRKTEIEAIVGSVINEALSRKQDVPILQFLYESIRGKEEKT